MADSKFDPRRVDLPAFAKSGQDWAQRVPMRSFPRVVASAHADTPPTAEAQVAIVAQADAEPRHGASQYGLTLAAEATLSMVCQRCLAPVEVPLKVDRRFLFAPDEATAAALDADLEDEVLAFEQPFDLLTLVEDELLLAMPLVPVHELCPEPLLPPPDAVDDPADEREHPFAALAQLKQPPQGGER